MDFRSLGIVLSFFIPFVLPAQQSGTSVDQISDYHHFKGVLEEETGKVAESYREDFEPVLHPAVLPDSLSLFPVARNGEVYGLGISDPGMEAGPGHRLALERAVAITAILTGAGMKSLVDNFSSETEKKSGETFVTKYLNYYRITANKRMDTNNFHVAWSYRTPFGETMVLTVYRIQESVSGVPVNVEAEVYQVERQKGDTYSAEERIGFRSLFGDQSQDSATEYSIYARNNLFEIYSIPWGQQQMFPYRNYRYSMEDSADEKDDGYSSRLNYGLWKSFLELFLQEAYMAAQKTDVYIKQVGDAFSTKTQHLSREIHTDAPVFAIRGIRVYDNQLSIQFNQLQDHVTDQ